MKIAALETHIVTTPPHVGGMYWIFVKLRTDCGIEGIGESIPQPSIRRR